MKYYAQLGNSCNRTQKMCMYINTKSNWMYNSNCFVHNYEYFVRFLCKGTGRVEDEGCKKEKNFILPKEWTSSVGWWPSKYKRKEILSTLKHIYCLWTKRKSPFLFELKEKHWNPFLYFLQYLDILLIDLNDMYNTFMMY